MIHLHVGLLKRAEHLQILSRKYASKNSNHYMIMLGLKDVAYEFTRAYFLLMICKCVVSLRRLYSYDIRSITCRVSFNVALKSKMYYVYQIVLPLASRHDVWRMTECINRHRPGTRPMLRF